MADTPTTRKARERERKRAQGLVKVEVWVPPSAKDAIRALAKKLRGETR